MRAADLLDALDLPPSARVERRIPKKLLGEHGAPTAADKRKINEGIEHLEWVAALKPGTVGVAEYRNGAREYLEIAVLNLVLRKPAKVDRLVELVHRAVPYPVVAITEHGGHVELSLAHKRWSHGEAGKVVLDGDVVAVNSAAIQEPMREPFLTALALGRQPRADLFVLYQSWLDTVLALHAACHTNSFAIPSSVGRRADRQVALVDCARLATEIARLRVAATREKQIPKQVELNLELNRLEAERAAALERL